MISTDYHEPKLSTADVRRSTTFGQPWTVFSREEIGGVSMVSQQHGFALVEPIRWGRGGAPIRWARKRYTFIFLAFRKVSARE